MNKVFLIGNLTRDPELSETASNVPMCRFRIAVGRNYAGPDGERQTDFFNCTAWRNQAEVIARYAKKGNKVAVTGSVQLREYEDNSGVKHTTVDVVCQDVEFLTPKGQNNDFDEAPVPNNTKKAAALQPMDDDEDIPF